MNVHAMCHYAMQSNLEGVVYGVKSLPVFHAAFIRR